MNIKFLKSVIFSFFLATILFTPFVSYGQDGFLAGQALESSQNACQTQHQVGTDAYNKCVEQARANLENAANPVVKPIVMIGEAAGNAFMKALFLPIGYFLITISSAILTFSGWIFDGIVKLTIIDVANYLGSGTDMGKAIFQAWSTLRDIANIFFIFVLIYAALKAMFDLNFGSSGTLIKNIILVALLINFSLFFTKVVIDASNVVSLGFYQSIANSNTATFSGRLTGTSDGVTEFKGITAGYMKMLGLQSMFDAGILTENLPVPDMMMISILGSLFLLIASVIFLISGIMFITRFVILIFLMILSPLALIAIIIPGGMATFNKWKDALISQSFFAPLFFALTWVAFKIGSALIVTRPSNTVWTELFTKPAASETGTTGILLNFTLVIGFSIAALVFAKSMATKTAGFTQISGAIGAGAVGGTAWAGRQIVGRGANALAQSSWLRNAATDGKYGSKYLARMTLKGADKTAGASFNIGGIADTKLGKMVGANKVLDPSVMGKVTGAGGFAKAVEEKAKKKAEYAKRVYGQTEAEKEEIKKREGEEKERILSERKSKHDEAESAQQEATKNRREYLQTHTKDNQETYDELKKDKKNVEKSLKGETDPQEIAMLKKELERITERMKNERELMKEIENDLEKNDSAYKNLKQIESETTTKLKEAKNRLAKKDIGDDEYSKEIQEFKNKAKERQKKYAERLRGRFNLAGNVAAARAVEKQAEGKSKAEKLAEAALDLQKDLDKNTGSAQTTPEPVQEPVPQPQQSP